MKQALRLVLRTLAVLLAVPGGVLLLLGALGLALHGLASLHHVVGFDIGGPVLAWWGYLLYERGVREPLVESGGGVAWLTPLGVVVVYLIPASILGGAAWIMVRLSNGLIRKGPVRRR